MCGSQDQNVATSVFNIANILNDWGEEAKAYQYFQSSLKLYITAVKDESISVANYQQNLGVLFFNSKDIDQSLQSLLWCT